MTKNKLRKKIRISFKVILIQKKKKKDVVVMIKIFNDLVNE